jgi:DNA-binding FadR family transcriptional regulator
MAERAAVKRRPKFEQVADRLQKAIMLDEKYLPGDRLPDERTMATEFGVSRTSIREAVKMLEARGLVVVKKSHGIFVDDFPGISEDPLGLHYLEDKHRLLHDWYSVRLALEPEIVRMVVENAKDKEIEELASLEQEEAAMIEKDDMSFLDVDKHFHMMLATATHNVVIRKLIPSLQQSVYYGLAETMYEDLSDRYKKNALEKHKSIVTFLEKRDAGGAMLAMRLHLLQAIEDINDIG